MANARLIGRLTGTFPVNMRQAQSMLPVMREAKESQQPEVGDLPPLVLPVMTFMHGVKLVIRELVHAVVI